jgi:hypothetical protein
MYSEEERAMMVRDAQEQLFEAIENIKEATKGLPNQGYWKAYMIDHLQIMASADHGFLSRDANLDQLLQELTGSCKLCGETASNHNPMSDTKVCSYCQEDVKAIAETQGLSFEEALKGELAEIN